MNGLRTPVATLLFIAAFLVSAQASAAGFTEGKTIRILVGFSPGGGHDTESRLIAQWIPKYLPGMPNNVIVENRPGAGGAISAAYFYHRVKPDGLSWSIMGSTEIGDQALGKSQVDLLKMSQLFATSGSGAAIVRASLGVQKPEDIMKVKPSDIVVSGRTLLGPSFLTDVLGLDLLGIKGYKYVVGYAGTAQMALAFESGEITYVGGTGLHHVLGKQGRYYEMIQQGKAFPLWQTGVVTPEGNVVRAAGTEIPTYEQVYEKIKGEKPSGVEWDAYKLVGPSIRTLTRYLVVPPGVPEDRVAALRTAFDNLYKDPKFVAEWQRIFGLQLDYVKGQDADKILTGLLSPSPGWAYLKDEFIPKLQGKK